MHQLFLRGARVIAALAGLAAAALLMKPVRTYAAEESNPIADSRP